MIKIHRASSDHHYNLIESLAHEIWYEHYTPIIGSGQVNYMLDKFQSATAIKSQVEDGYIYFLIDYLGSHVGYLSFKKEESALFLSKVYVLNELRGKGIGREAILFAENFAKKCGLPKVRLTVNKDNINSKKSYEKLGFTNCGSVVMDIGNGYVMDDYAMEKEF